MTTTTRRLGIAAAAMLLTGGTLALQIPAAQAAPLVTPSSPSEFIAGTGNTGCPVDGADATSSDLDDPWDALPDALGNTYISLVGCNRVYRIDSAGKIHTFAGTGSVGSGGDGGLATAATLCRPIGLALSPDGTAVYIAEQGASDPNLPCVNYGRVIRKVDLTSGLISTIAGTVGQGGTSGDNGPATSAKFESPSGITFDASGNLFVADYNGENVRKIDSGGTITTFRQFPPGSGARQVAFDSNGVMYYAVANDHKVYKYDPVTTNLSTIANGGGDSLPEGVAVDGSGNVYVTDRGFGSGFEQSIHVVKSDGSSTYGASTLINASTTGCGSGTTAAQLQVSYAWLMHVTPDGKSLLVAIGGCNKIARFGPAVTAGTATTVTAPSGSSTFGTAGTLGSPTTTEDSGGATVTFSGSDTAPTCQVLDGSNNPITLSTSTAVGVYTTRCSGAVKSGYAFSYTDGTWTVSAPSITGSGYFLPVYPSVVNVIKAGYRVDLKFRVFNGATPVTDPSTLTFSATEVTCVVGAPSNTVKSERGSTTAARFVAKKKASEGYFYAHWQAPSAKGKCYTVSHSAGGSPVVTAVFRTS